MRGLRLTSAALLMAGAVALSACGGSDPQPASERPPAVAADPGNARALQAITVGRTPAAVAVAGGIVWVADETRGTVQRVDARTRRPVGRAIPVGTAPFALAVGEGAVWVAGGDGSIRSIDPKTAEVEGPPIRVPGANGLAVGAGGVWVTSRIAATVTRIDPETRRAGPPTGVGDGPADVVVFDGAVWVANAAAGTVSRVDPESMTAAEPIDTGGSGVLALAAGEEGMWLARAVGVVADRVEVVRLDTDAGEVAGEPVAVTGAVPLDLAVGAGSVWATDVGGVQPPGEPRPGSVTRIDPGSAKVIGGPIRVGERPSGVAVDAGGAWVANAGDGTLTPVRVTR